MWFVEGNYQVSEIEDLDDEGDVGIICSTKPRMMRGTNELGVITPMFKLRFLEVWKQ